MQEENKSMEEKMAAELQIRMDILKKQGYLSEAEEPYDDDKVYLTVTEGVPDDTTAALLDFESDPEMNEIRRSFEKDFGYKVYAGIKTCSIYGDYMLSLLFVSTYEEDWEVERAVLQSQIPFAQVFASNNPVGDLGTIGYMVDHGKLIRTA